MHRFAQKMTLTVAGVVLVAAVSGGEDHQHARQALENRVKAGFLYTFTKYVEWPAAAFESSTNAFVIGVLGTDPFGATLDEVVAGKTMDGQAVRVKRFGRVEDAQHCQMLFVGPSEQTRLASIQAHLRERPVLTVSDLDDFLQQGGHVQFVIEDGRVKFDINLEAARRAGLNLDANLLRVARRVSHHNGQPGAD